MGQRKCIQVHAGQSIRRDEQSGRNLAFIIEDTYLGWDRRQYFEEEYHCPVYTFDKFLEKIGQYKNESEGLNDHQIDQFSILL